MDVRSLLEDDEIRTKTVFILAVLTRSILADCQENCISCTGKTTYSCTKCKSSHFLIRGYCFQCPDSCTACVNSNKCLSCASGRYGETCQLRCNKNCERCHIGNGICTRCKDGYYGQYCEHNCNLCEGGQCGMRSCTIGCIRAFYKNDTSGGCHACSWECSDCESFTKCNNCTEGYYLYHLKNNVGVALCYKCSNRACQEKCDIEHCKICKLQSNSKVCEECDNSYSLNGSMCVNNTNICSTGCSSGCNPSGLCVGNCIDGYTGAMCTDPCPNQCLKCNKKYPSICQRCVDGWYKSDCSIRCSNHCKNGSSSTCRLNDGYCINECKNNFWGGFCNSSCPAGCASDRSNATLCNRVDGRCMNGCKEGFVGDKCDTVLDLRKSSEDIFQKDAGSYSTDSKPEATIFPTSTTSTELGISKQYQCEEKHVKNISFFTAYISGLGSSVAITALIASIYCIRRRFVLKKARTDKKSQETTEMISYYNVSANDTQHTKMTGTGEHSYESLRVDRNTDKVYSELETQRQKPTIRT